MDNLQHSPPFKKEKVITNYSYEVLDEDAIHNQILKARKKKKLKPEYFKGWRKRFIRDHRDSLADLGIIKINIHYAKHDGSYFYCPICYKWIEASDYLREVFEDIPTRWFANMVMDYRHDHRPSYDRWIGYHARNGRYYDEKHKVNEQIKRQILRLAGDYCRDISLVVDDVAALQGTTEKTLEVAGKVLECLPKNK